jgi:hypothetical protein
MKSYQSPGKALAEECYQYIAWVTGAVEKFPRSHKFLLGDEIHAMSIELLMLIVQATYTRDRASLLRRAQIFLWMAFCARRHWQHYQRAPGKRALRAAFNPA